MSTIEDILIEDKQVLDLVANTEIEKIESDEDTKYEDVEHSDEDEQVLTPLCYDKGEMKAKKKKGFMNMMEGETFQMKIGNEDSDDEEVEEWSSFSRFKLLKNFSKKYKRNFSKLKEAERKIVNTSNGKIQINYEGPSGPFEETH